MGQPRPSLTALKTHGGGSTQIKSYCTQNPWGWVNPDPVLLHSKPMGVGQPGPVLLHSKHMGVGQPRPSLIAPKTHGGGSTWTQSYCTQNTREWVNLDPVLLHSKHKGVGQTRPSLTDSKHMGWVNPDPVLLHSKHMRVGQPGPSLIALKTHEGGSTQTQSYCTQSTGTISTSTGKHL